MVRRPAHRLCITLFVMFSLLFSQMALATYVCPAASSDSAPRMAAMDMTADEPCAAMAAAPDQEQPLLCHQHCADAPQSFDPVHVPAVTLPAVVQVLLVPMFAGEADGTAPSHALAAQARPPPDPIFLSTLRLRV